jgi:hypothetical protein
MTTPEPPPEPPSTPEPPAAPPPASPPPPAPPPSPSWGTAPLGLRPEEHVRLAYRRRHESDYIFTGPGLNCFLTVVTCGIFGFYLLYKLMERMREHNRRRLQLLDGATTFAWERAVAAGLDEELRPGFERIAGHLEPLRAMSRDFRDPAAWVGIAVAASVFANAGFVVYFIAFYLLDDDLFKHDSNEGAIEAELAVIYARLGHRLPEPDPNRVLGKQNYAGRIVATIFTCGIYGLWWLYDMQVGPNRHFPVNWAWEDALANAVQAMEPARS